MGRPGPRARARREYLAALDTIDAADARLRQQLSAYRKLRQISRRHLEADGRAEALRELMDIRVARAGTDEALKDLSAARVRAQCALYRLAAAEGMTAAEIGRSWGVSRQFV